MTATASLPSVTPSTRDRILEVALRHFSVHGFDGTSLQQVADDLGLTKAALYYHFRSKDALLGAVLEPVFGDLETRLSALEEAREASAGRRGWLDDYVDFLLEHRRTLAFLNRDLSVLGRPEVRRRGEALRERVDGLWVGSDLVERERVLITVALAGMQGAVAAHPDAAPEVLRAAVTEAATAVLSTLQRSSPER